MAEIGTIFIDVKLYFSILLMRDKLCEINAEITLPSLMVQFYCWNSRLFSYRLFGDKDRVGEQLTNREKQSDTRRDRDRENRRDNERAKT